MGTKIPADRIYHSDKVLAGIPQLLDDFSQLIDDQETGKIKILHIKFMKYFFCLSSLQPMLCFYLDVKKKEFMLID